MGTLHRNWHSTTLCDCPWDKAAGAAESSKTAGKLHDFLQNPKSRPDLQTPEAQSFLKDLEHSYHNERTDPLMPWLTREWKKGRIDFRQDRPWLWHFNQEHEPIRPISPGEVDHWADWYGSQAPNRQGHDIMQSTAWDVQHQKIPEWESWMRDEATRKEFGRAKDLGKVLHTYDDGWTVRQLPPEALEYEGDAMKSADGYPICVGAQSYQNAVHDGDSAIVSLRDPEGRPHVTGEITPYSGMGDEVGEYEWPHGFEHVLNEHPFVKHTGDDFKNQLREIDEEHRDSSPGLLHDLAQNYDESHSGLNNGNPYYVYNNIRGDRARRWPPLEKGTIEQIQGRGNSVPKPEYQQRMKDWFQTFPEHLRPNWEYGHQYPITHIGALVPDAESWEPNYGVVEGDPGEQDDEAQGGYGPHGDYGLSKPAPPSIDYGSVLASLNRERSWRDDERRYDPSEGHALYEEAKRRGEIPALANALSEHWDNIALPHFDQHVEQNYDYYPHYPGESWDEEPERWLTDEETGERRTPEEAQDTFKDAYQAYENGQEEAVNNVPEMETSSQMHKLLSPHWDGAQQTYVNEVQPQPPQQTVSKLAAPKPFSNKGVKPAYYRWVYSPANGEVDLAHNWRDHPAEIAYHAQMAADRNEPGLVHGYAYRIHGGWRLTDWDHRPVADPYVIARVIRALRQREGVQQAPVSPQRAKSAGLDWDHLHYGLPLPIVNN